MMSKQHRERGLQLNSTSDRLLITNVISTSDHRHFLDIGIGCMSVQNLKSTSNSYLTTNVISPSDHRPFLDINIWIKMYVQLTKN